MISLLFSVVQTTIINVRRWQYVLSFFFEYCVNICFGQIHNYVTYIKIIGAGFTSEMKSI